MGISATLDTPFYTGDAVSSDVPSRFPISIGGHPYMVDLSFKPYRRDAFRHRSIPSTRPASDIQNLPGMNTINVEGLWRRAQEDWSHGAGQVHFDRRSSDPARFRTSKGVNVWTQWQMSLLNATANARATANTNLYATVVNTGVYVTDGAAIARTTDLATFTAVTGLPATAPSSICSDGYSFYSAHGAAGIYSGNGTAASQYVTTGSYTNVAYVKGRLMASFGNLIYNIIASGAGPAALFTHPNPNWTWVGFAEGPGFIYAAGYAGSTSAVYRIGIQPDGTSLSSPINAGNLPPGEIVYSISQYANTYLMIGTNKGMHFAEIAGNGDIVLGSTLPVNPNVTLPVRCFTSSANYIWFGWSNFDGVSTGLGRLNLQTFIDPQTPAFASDLMATTQGEVTSVVSFNNLLMFGVSGVGFFAQAATFVASGTIDSGYIQYDIPDDKIAVFLDCRYVEPMTGEHDPFLSVDRGPFVSIGKRTSNQARSVFSIPQVRGGEFEVREQLVSGNGGTPGPTITRHILKSLPGIASGTTISVTAILADEVVDLGGASYAMDIGAELAFLEGLRQSQQIVTYQEGRSAYSVTVDSIDFLPESYNHTKTAFNAVAVIYLKTLSG